jgi:hypothetical protein
MRALISPVVKPYRRAATDAQPLDELDQRLRRLVLIRLWRGDRRQ